MDQVIVAYQFNRSSNLYSDGFPDYKLAERCHIHWGSSVHMMWNVVAKWSIKLKGGIPKLDTPILSEEDVKDLND